LAAAAVLAVPKAARAQLPAPEALPIASVKGWDVTLDGRMSTFVSFAHGDQEPGNNSYPQWQGFYDWPAADGKITDTRLRSGFVSNLLGWGLHRQVNKDYAISGRFAIWGNISQKRDKTLIPDVDLREVYLKVDGPWGSVLAGRNIGLFGRGGINLDYDIEHGYGLGSPCMIVNREPSQGPVGACGHVGFGILFPAFNAQITYSTPELAGFQLSAGLFDPATVQESNYTRTPLPRVEGELSFKAAKAFHAEVSGSWQRIGHADPQTNPDVDSLGVAAAAGVNLGPLQLGVAGFTGQGLGIWVALENYPVFSDPAHVLRKQKGVLGMAALNFGHTKIAAGVGETLIGATANDVFIGTVTVPATPNFPNRQLGYSAGIYQGLLDDLVLGLDFFSANTRWNPAPVPNDPAAPPFTPKQTVNFVNLGATLVF
jgi:hypothetical protein